LPNLYKTLVRQHFDSIPIKQSVCEIGARICVNLQSNLRGRTLCSHREKCLRTIGVLRFECSRKGSYASTRTGTMHTDFSPRTVGV